MNRSSPTKRQYLRELVYEKNRWDETLTEEDKANGFLGWHERGYLPHCDRPGLCSCSRRSVEMAAGKNDSELEVHYGRRSQPYHHSLRIILATEYWDTFMRSETQERIRYSLR
jgi:hypothetical protein